MRDPNKTKRLEEMEVMCRILNDPRAERDVLHNILKEHRALCNIKAVIDAYQRGGFTVTVGCDDFDTENHVYDISTMVAMIQSFTYDGLCLPNPGTTRRKEV